MQRKKIEAAASLQEELVWYERKLVMFANIQDGKEKMPDKQTYDKIVEIMKDIKKRTGYDGVKNDFDWGMINGKLSALRWALGDEWDNLDT